MEQCADRIFEQLTAPFEGHFRTPAARAFFLDGASLRTAHSPVLHQRCPADRNSHPHLPAEAVVCGCLIVRRAQPSNGAAPFLRALFSTASLDQEEFLQLYGLRWNIETDLRSLKSTFRLDQLTSTTPEMVAKEIEMAIVAYNLLRAAICLAAEHTGVPPRGFSFTKVRLILETFLPLLAAATNPQQVQRCVDDMMYYINQARLPRRRKPRPSYPRQAWGRPRTFPTRKA